MDSPLSPQFDQPLHYRDLRYRSVESLDSGCDIETPRLSIVERQHPARNHNGEATETTVVTDIITATDTTPLVESGHHSKVGTIDIVCDLKLLSADQSKISIPQNDCKTDISPTCKHSDNLPEISDDSSREKTVRVSTGKRPENPNAVPAYDDLDSSTDDDLVLMEPFRLVEPRSISNKETLEYAQQLRQKLSWKLAADRALRKSRALETVKESSSSISKSEGSSSSDVANPDILVNYHDPDLTDFVARTFNAALSVRENITVKPDDILVGCFVPKLLEIPDCTWRADLAISPTESTTDSLNWSDGEAWEMSDGDCS